MMQLAAKDAVDDVDLDITTTSPKKNLSKSYAIPAVVLVDGECDVWFTKAFSDFGRSTKSEYFKCYEIHRKIHLTHCSNQW